MLNINRLRFRKGSNPTLEQVTAKVESAFQPDLTFTWDTKTNCWIMKAENEIGEVFFKKYRGIRSKLGTLIPNSLFGSVYDSALKCGMTCQTIGEP